MQLRPPQEAQLDDLVEFDRQLQMLVRAGIPLQTDSGMSDLDLLTRSQQLQGRIALQTAKGASFWDAFQSSPDLPSSYRSAFVSWFSTNRDADAFRQLQPIRMEHAFVGQPHLLRIKFSIILFLAVVIFGVWVISSGRLLQSTYGHSDLDIGPVTAASISIFKAIPSPVLLFLWFIATLAAGLFVVHSIWSTPRFKTSSRNSDRKLDTSLPSQSRGILLNELRGVDERQVDSQLHQSRLKSSLVQRTDLQGTRELIRCAFPSSSDGEIDTTLMSDKRVPMALIAENWALEQQSERALRRKFSYRPYAVFIFSSGIIVLIVALSVFSPVIELLNAISARGVF